METAASFDNMFIKARRYVVGTLREYHACVTTVREGGKGVTIWLTYDLKRKTIKCYSEGYSIKVRGFYPMTRKGVKQAYHDIREYAYNIK